MPIDDQTVTIRLQRIRLEGASARGNPVAGKRACTSGRQGSKELSLTRGAYCDEMAFEIDHVGAVVRVEITRDAWSAEAILFAVSADGSRIMARHDSMGAAGPSRGIAAITKRYAGSPLPEDPDARRRVVGAYRVQRHDVEDAMNQLLGRDPDMHRPPRLSWGPLIELLAKHGKVVSEEELIAMPFRFEFPAEALAAL